MTIGVVFVFGLITVWAVYSYNRLVRDRNRVETAWSDIDVQLKKRHDLIPKLVATVDQYAAFERSTLTTLIELRSRVNSVDDLKRKGALEGEIGSGLRSLMALVEAYPQLKADQNFLQLQTELSEVENQIQYARRFYNGTVRNLNTRIESFPDLLIARLFGCRQRQFFELEGEHEAEPTKMEMR
ncbi:MAG: hypothetical protein C0614_05860 [Desulfuromonas sp.]|nr:MAG: hypothetical protein C0614_05860 [Desulfuromonas sp.]